jgi:hypothetical protein
MPISLNAILVSIVVPSLLELSQALVSDLIIQISVCIKMVGNQGVEAIFSKAALSAAGSSEICPIGGNLSSQTLTNAHKRATNVGKPSRFARF